MLITFFIFFSPHFYIILFIVEFPVNGKYLQILKKASPPSYKKETKLYSSAVPPFIAVKTNSLSVHNSKTNMQIL